MKQTDKRKNKEVGICAICGGDNISKSKVKGYKYYCADCNEDLYGFEVYEK